MSFSRPRQPEQKRFASFSRKRRPCFLPQAVGPFLLSNIAILLLPDFSHLGLAAVIEPLFVANWLARRPIHAWTTVSIDGKPVRASNGLMTQPDTDLSGVTACETVLVLASFDAHQAARHRAARAWLRRMARAGAEIGGIENGSLLLAETGLLNGRQAAVHWDNLPGIRELYPQVRTVEQLYTRSGRIFTCAGAASVLDLMVAWIGWHGEPDLAAEVAQHLLLGHARAADAPQRPTASPQGAGEPDVKIAAAQELMRAHLEEPLTCDALAARVGLSLRQLERRMQRHSGSSVVQEYLTLRLSRAHQLLQQTELGVTDVSLACGFSSASYFSRAYRRSFGCLPSEDRRQSVAAPVSSSFLKKRTKKLLFP